jgi:hypothetical protein
VRSACTDVGESQCATSRLRTQGNGSISFGTSTRVPICETNLTLASRKGSIIGNSRTVRSNNIRCARISTKVQVDTPIGRMDLILTDFYSGNFCIANSMLELTQITRAIIPITLRRTLSRKVPFPTFSERVFCVSSETFSASVRFVAKAAAPEPLRQHHWNYRHLAIHEHPCCEELYPAHRRKSQQQ